MRSRCASQRTLNQQMTGNPKTKKIAVNETITAGSSASITKGLGDQVQSVESR